MKKTLAAAITSALVIGAASTTFAAANPFSDVATDHWSFDAVAKLAQEGVIEGYGDNTFRGDSHITRYEMAQMVAKAMAKEDKANAQQKAMIDKLAAEYAAELDNLGVRVANLEEKVGNVTWGGKVRLRLISDDPSDGDRNTTTSQSYAELWANAKINSDWSAHVKVTSDRTMDKEETHLIGNDASSNNVFVEGPLFGADAKFGKFDVFTNNYGYVMDDPMTGAQLTWKGDKLTTTVRAGRLTDEFWVNEKYDDADNFLGYDNADTQSIELTYGLSNSANVNAAYYNVSTQNWDDENLHIWTLGFDSKLGEDWKIDAVYAKSNADGDDIKDNGYSVNLTYKGADIKTVGSYDVWLGYRNTPVSTQISTTNFGKKDYKGWELGFDYVPAENIQFQARYFDSKNIYDSDIKDKQVRAQVEFFF
ncbi:S-layer homology domain-containing protein [Anaerosinus gibii]|uniref:S-layer homology domain-containing protein n=1 Tax=Selenobaculum gibii TaxID=3054208 RepID=A0A9Y2ERD4_9FIRM|nr:S-layer homology domain-containing protein [Selenobaculum gbiensis]WIW71057.1 S-layer homology domain-containing protein [Selenobaculum gbiensis]